MPKIALAIAFISTLPQGLLAQTVPHDRGAAVDGSTGNGPLAITIGVAPGEIRIDGELTDAGWAKAVRAVGWTEFSPRKRATPPVETEALLTYDGDHFYVAFNAHTDPREIRATLRDRDQAWNDDLVAILIDTHGDGSSGLLVMANPLGVQGDLLLTAGGEDDSFDIIYRARARITDTGYQVEMAIPFRSLRIPARDVQTWRINFYRNLPRSSRHQIAWAPLDADNPCIVCQSALLHGLEGIVPGGQLELLPAIVAAQAGTRSEPSSAFVNGRPSFTAALGAKYAFTSGWTAEATLNPDFSQVESDAAQVDVNTTFALFFPERRPFFQEGSDLFDTFESIVYTRSINDPVAAAKLTGRVGRSTRIAYLGARDEHTPFIVPFEERSMVLQAGRSVSNVVRLRHGFREDSHFGLLLTDRRLDGGGSGSNLSLDGSIRFAKSYRLRTQVTASHTAEPNDAGLTADNTETFGRDESYTAAFDGERFAGRSTYLSLDRSARVWSFQLSYVDATPTFRADNGFQTRNDFRRASASTYLSFYPRNGIDRITLAVESNAVWNFGAERNNLSLSPSLGLALPRQTYVSVNGLLVRERFRDVAFDGIRRLNVYVSTSPHTAASFGGSAGAGRSIARNLAAPALGDARDVSVWGSFKPVQRLVLEPSLSWTRLEHLNGENIFDGYIFRARTSYQFTHELFARVVTQYNEFVKRIDVEPLLMYRINPFSIFYLGSTHGYAEVDDPTRMIATDRQIFLKLQYLFRL